MKSDRCCRILLALLMWFGVTASCVLVGTGSSGNLFVWSQNDWDLLAERFAHTFNTTHGALLPRNDSGQCENAVDKVWISIPPISDDKTVLRPRHETQPVNTIDPLRVRALAERPDLFVQAVHSFDDSVILFVKLFGEGFAMLYKRLGEKSFQTLLKQVAEGFPKFLHELAREGFQTFLELVGKCFLLLIELFGAPYALFH
jgi:hypothetical protein